jgi:hypothetical protein
MTYEARGWDLTYSFLIFLTVLINKSDIDFSRVP